MTSSDLPSRSRERISQLLQELSRHGQPQRAVANQLGIPNQYLTDYKNGRRRLNEAVARKLEAEFGEKWNFTASWLMGETLEEPPAPPEAAQSDEIVQSTAPAQLPVFFHPIEGDPYNHPKWNGFLIEVSGAAKATLRLAKHPYVLQFGATDRENRIQSGDMLLMSQLPPLDSIRIQTAIQVIRHGRGMYLARRVKDGWQRLAKEFPTIPLKDCTVHGHAVAIIFGALT